MGKNKTVAGQGRGQIAYAATTRAMADGKSPTYVDHWLDWFDKSPCDELPVKSEKTCAGCLDKDACDTQQNKLKREKDND